MRVGEVYETKVPLLVMNYHPHVELKVEAPRSEDGQPKKYLRNPGSFPAIVGVIPSKTRVEISKIKRENHRMGEVSWKAYGIFENPQFAGKEISLYSIGKWKDGDTYIWNGDLDPKFVTQIPP